MTTTTDLSMTPYQVADETFVVPWILEAPPVGLFPMNSLVIRGAEPVIVDTGSPANREQWLNNVWNLVDPMDVRWIFLSHDDRDHAGNLLPVLAACPNATLLTNWFSIGRMAEEWMTPLDRCRFLNDGERLDIGDRTLSAIRPPLFDNPTTRGLFDSHTGLYWSVDTFATPIPRPVQDASELSDEEFNEGQRLGAGVLAPWHVWLDEKKFNAYVDEVRSLPIQVIAACHAPAITGPRIERAFEALHDVPGMEPWQPFVHQDLEQWLAMMAQG